MNICVYIYIYICVYIYTYIYIYTYTHTHHSASLFVAERFCPSSRLYLLLVCPCIFRCPFSSHKKTKETHILNVVSLVFLVLYFCLYIHIFYTSKHSTSRLMARSFIFFFLGVLVLSFSMRTFLWRELFSLCRSAYNGQTGNIRV